MNSGRRFVHLQMGSGEHQTSLIASMERSRTSALGFDTQEEAVAFFHLHAMDQIAYPIEFERLPKSASLTLDSIPRK